MQPSLFAAAPAQQRRLPRRLREISGLAVTSDGRLFGHDDERAVIYEIDVEGGQIVKSFAIGDPPRRPLRPPGGESAADLAGGGSASSAELP